MKKVLAGWFLLMFVSTNYAQTIYKYQDKSGHWHFSDEKPSTVPSSQWHYKSPSSANEEKPQLIWQQAQALWQLVAINPYFMPIQIQVQLAGQSLTRVLPAHSHSLMIEQNDNTALHYHYVFGDPKAEASTSVYHLPLSANSQTSISQGFAGAFSHHDKANYYAVDIAAPVGTKVLAARAGVVAQVIDHYVLADTNAYFADKANRIIILHDDGTMAIYAHLLADSAKVAPGQSVNIGDELALTGSTGYSTGPHLHFAIWKNSGMQITSLPFSFYYANSQKTFTPTQGASLMAEP